MIRPCVICNRDPQSTFVPEIGLMLHHSQPCPRAGVYSVKEWLSVNVKNEPVKSVSNDGFIHVVHDQPRLTPDEIKAIENKFFPTQSDSVTVEAVIDRSVEAPVIEEEPKKGKKNAGTK